jgi:hypothetical protein
MMFQLYQTCICNDFPLQCLITGGYNWLVAIKILGWKTAEDIALAFPNQPRAAVGEVVTKVHGKFWQIFPSTSGGPVELPTGRWWGTVPVNWGCHILSRPVNEKLTWCTNVYYVWICMVCPKNHGQFEKTLWIPASKKVIEMLHLMWHMVKQWLDSHGMV